jgi:hypothetical protein
MSAEIVGRCHHCVVSTSLTVSDDGDLGKAYRLETRPTWRPLALLVLGSSPMLWQSLHGRLIRLRLRWPWPSAPPSSSGLGHRPFKAAARVRIPLGARAEGDRGHFRFLFFRVASPSGSRIGQRRRDGPLPVGSAAGRAPWPAAGRRQQQELGRGQVQRPQRAVEHLPPAQGRVMQAETRAHQRAARSGVAGELIISTERIWRFARVPRISHAALLPPPTRRGSSGAAARLSLSSAGDQ